MPDEDKDAPDEAVDQSRFHNFDMEQSTRQFLASCRPSTAVAYGRDLELYRAYCETLGLALGEIRRYHVMGFVEARRRAGDAPATLRRRLAAVRAFHDFLSPEGGISPALDVPVPPAPRPGGVSFGADEVAQLFAVGCADRAYHEDALVAVVLLVGYRLQAQELPTIGARAARRARGRWWLDHEGRSAPLPDAFAAIMPSQPRHAGLVYALGRTANPVARQTVGRWLRTLGEDAGLATPCSPRVLRRSAVPVAISIGVDPTVALARDWFELQPAEHPALALAEYLEPVLSA